MQQADALFDAFAQTTHSLLPWALSNPAGPEVAVPVMLED